MILYFIRHAQSINNALWGTSERPEYVLDPPLTEVGHQQAAHLARFLKEGSANGEAIREGNPPGFGITHLYCSLMTRAIQTGQAVAGELGLPLVAWTDLHEYGGVRLYDPDTEIYNPFPGNPREHFDENHPNLVLPPDLKPGQGWWSRPSETREECVARSQRLLAELLEKHGGTEHVVVLISHGAFFKFFTAAVLGMATTEGYRFEPYNTGITRFVFKEDRTTTNYMNRITHLPLELVT
jgi:2,3-bisphosphoglycerate-dependent phosphoglycerate mutase